MDSRMFVDVEAASLSLHAMPEDYRFVMRFTQGDEQISTAVLEVFETLLCGYVDKRNLLSMSLYDFIELRKKLRAVNLEQRIHVSQRAFEVYKQHVEMVRFIEAIKAGGMNLHIPDGLLKSTLWDDQKAAVAFHLASGRSGNWFSVGLGKTLVALTWHAMLVAQGKTHLLMVICMNDNKTTWRREIEKHTYLMPHALFVRNGTKEVVGDIERCGEERKGILVIHYDSLIGPPARSKDPPPPPGVHVQKKPKPQFFPGNSPIVQALLRLKPDTIICDEAHILKDMEAKRTKCVFRLFEGLNPQNALFMTATPVSESPLNAYPVLKLIRPQIVPPNYTRFKYHFVNFYQHEVTRRNKQTGLKYRTGVKVEVINKSHPWKNLPELAEMNRIYGFRKTHADVKGMPPTVDQLVQVALTGPQLALYNEIAAETYSQVAAIPANALNLDLAVVRTIRLRQSLSSPGVLQEAGESAKYLALDDIVEQHLSDPTNKMLIWSAFKPACDLIAERYKDYDAVPFHGDIPQKTLDKYETDFLDKATPRILVCTPDKAGVGKNLQRARMDVWVDNPVRLLHYEQGRGRIERRNAQGTSVHVTIKAPGTIDQWVEDLLKMKADMKQKLLDADDHARFKIDKDKLLSYLKGV